jgi:hypothetical protein
MWHKPYRVTVTTHLGRTVDDARYLKWCDAKRRFKRMRRKYPGCAVEVWKIGPNGDYEYIRIGDKDT